MQTVHVIANHVSARMPMTRVRYGEPSFDGAPAGSGARRRRDEMTYESLDARARAGEPEHHNAWGALVLAFVRWGLLEPIDEWRSMRSQVRIVGAVRYIESVTVRLRPSQSIGPRR